MKEKTIYIYLMLAFTCMSFFAAKASSLLVINGSTFKEDPAPKLMIGKLITTKSTEKKQVIVKGKLIDDKTKMPITGAIVSIKGSNKTVVSNNAGLYLFTIPEELKSKDLYLQVNYQGYDRKSIYIPKEKLPSSNYKIEEVLKKTIRK